MRTLFALAAIVVLFWTNPGFSAQVGAQPNPQQEDVNETVILMLREVSTIGAPTRPLHELNILIHHTEEMIYAMHQAFQKYERVKDECMKKKKEYEKPLISALASHEPDIAARAALFLGEIQSSAAVKPLCNAVSRDALPEAAMALGMIGDKHAAPILLRILQTGFSEVIPAVSPGYRWEMEAKHALVMEYSAWALAQLNVPSTAASLIELLKDHKYPYLLRRNGFGEIREIRDRIERELAQMNEPVVVSFLFDRITKEGRTTLCGYLARKETPESDAAMYVLSTAGAEVPAIKEAVNAYKCLQGEESWENLVIRKYGKDFTSKLPLEDFKIEINNDARIVLLYGRNLESAAAIKTMLDNYGLATRILSTKDLNKDSLRHCSVAICGEDTYWGGNGPQASSTSEHERALLVEAMADYIVALGSGGADWLHQVGSVFAGHGCGMNDSEIVPVLPKHPLFNEPFSVQGSTITIVNDMNRSLGSEGIHVTQPLPESVNLYAVNPSRNERRFAVDARSWDVHVLYGYLLEEKPKHLFYGIEFDHPEDLTQAGQELFVNLVTYALRQAESN